LKTCVPNSRFKRKITRGGRNRERLLILLSNPGTRSECDEMIHVRGGEVTRRGSGALESFVIYSLKIKKKKKRTKSEKGKRGDRLPTRIAKTMVRS